ncbi:DUF5058 domain-containing protein [Arthrobacter sp. MYb23]|uniref:DUF5058 family protein n=1 Tax=unclassified Arthrobacter TaxID=235627 RepID=UPI000CFA8F02|nr:MULTISPECIES: DUF5058 family protein [unclassified Arthrobacter]PRB41080.1 DUF5058 domain-containing protein [Arthrobacter sp. MYb51]PRB94750.1 DUF5058 domain-containing protein [Arthrobacter sp. MYb23]
MPELPMLDPGSSDILGAANSPVLWIAAVGVFAVIAAQSAIYFVAVRKAAPAVGMSADDVARSVRAGAIAAIGPSLAVSLIAITLLGVFGTPGVLTRIGLIGSAAFDVAAAEVAAGAQGVTLGGEGYTQSVFATVLLCLSIAGSGWMIVTLIVTPLLKRGTARIEVSRSARAAAAMTIIPTAALLGAFMTFGIQQFQKGLAATVVVLASGGTMALCLYLAKRTGKQWLREWGLGFALVVGITTGVALASAGIA